MNLSPLFLDAFQEVGNIGLGNAATSLSQLLNTKVEMKVPRAGFLFFEEILPLVGGLEEVVACVYLRVEGDVPGTIVFVFKQESAFYLVDMLLGQEKGTTTMLDEMGESVVKEVGNVLTGSFINAICAMTNLNIVTTVPMFAFDMLAAVLSSCFVTISNADDQVLLIETSLLQDCEQITGQFFFFADPATLDKLFLSIGFTSGTF